MKSLKIIFIFIFLFIGFITNITNGNITNNNINNNTEKHNKIKEAPKNFLIPEKASVLEVIDGDTILVKLLSNDKVYKVRLLGMDTPEKFTTRTGYKECYGEEASNEGKRIIKIGSIVTLYRDLSQNNMDKHGRLLRFLFLENGIFYQEYMIKQGYAFYYFYKKPTYYDNILKKAEEISKSKKVGIWKYCDGKRKKIY